jgi:hypothetical protein
MQQDIREDAHSITDSTQTNWNGLVGGIQLRSTTPVWMKDVKVFPDIENKAVNLKIQIGNATGRAGKGELTAADKHIAVKNASSRPLKRFGIASETAPNGSTRICTTTTADDMYASAARSLS